MQRNIDLTKLLIKRKRSNNKNFDPDKPEKPTGPDDDAAIISNVMHYSPRPQFRCSTEQLENNTSHSFRLRKFVKHENSSFETLLQRLFMIKLGLGIWLQCIGGMTRKISWSTVKKARMLLIRFFTGKTASEMSQVCSKQNILSKALETWISVIRLLMLIPMLCRRI